MDAPSRDKAELAGRVGTNTSALLAGPHLSSTWERHKGNRVVAHKDPGGSQCLASLSAMDSNSLRFAVVMLSKVLISRLTGLPRFTCSGILGAEGFPSP